MNFIRILSTVVVATAGLAAQAQSAENFEQAKAMSLRMLDEKLADVQKARACVNAATTIDALKACRQDARADRRELRDEAQKNREEFRKSRRERREERAQ